MKKRELKYRINWQDAWMVLDKAAVMRWEPIR